MLRLFGTIEAGPASTSLTPVTAPRLRLIVSVLGAHLGERVSVDRLIDDLWPDDPPRTATSALQVYISKIRRLFEPDLAPRAESNCLRLDGQAYVLDLPVDDVDTARFARLAGTPDDAHDAEARWSEALALWSDPPFAEHTDAPWALAATSELHRTRLDVCRRLYGRAITEGRDADVVDALAADVEAHPHDERLAAFLMTAHYRLGDQTEALATGSRLRGRLRDDLGLDPTPELRELEQLILNHDASLLEGLRIRPPRRRVVAAERPPLFGRDAELNRIRTALDDHRLVTLAGPGGVGKTRLAHELTDVDPAASFIDLSPISSADQLIDHLTAVLGIEGDPLTDPGRSLATTIGERFSMLAFDNAEHLLPELSAVVAELLSWPAAFTLLVTSRRSLRLTAEHLIRIEPFPAPDPSSSNLANDPGIRILTAHSAAAVDSSNADRFVELHQRLDGLPLALELAAFRLRSAGLDDVLAAAPADDATNAPVDKPERHRSLDALVASSVADLSADRRELLEQMSVFAGPVPLEAVVRLMRGESSPVETRIGVADLVDRSLVSMSTDGPVRYRLLETVRSHCLSRLEQAGQLDQAYERHRTLVRTTAAVGLGGTRDVFDLDDLDDDVAAALDRLEHQPIDAAEHLGFVMAIATHWYSVNRVGEARTRLRRAIAAHPTADPISAGTANALLGMISFGEGAFDDLASATRTALDLLEPLGFPGLGFIRAGHHFGLGELDEAQDAIRGFLDEPTTVGRPRLAGLEVAATSAWFAGDHQTAATWYGHQVEAATDQQDRYFEAHARRGQAMMTAMLGDPDRGIDLCREADRLGDSDRQPRVRSERSAAAAVVRFSLGDRATAERAALDVLELGTQHFDAQSAALAVPIVAACALDADEFDRVALITGWFDGLCRSLGLFPPAASASLLSSVVEAATVQTDPDRWVARRADGAAAGLAAALDR